MTAPAAGYVREKLGNRDIVGFGMNGEPSYIDREDFPCPAVRFRENSSDVLALREKEKGDWKKMSLDEKKALYRASYCSTYAEMAARLNGEWKSILAGSIFFITVGIWGCIFLKHFVYSPLPRTATKEWREAELKRQIDQQQGIVQGVSSRWDYDKKEWK